MAKVYLKGKITDEKNAKISAFDRGFLYGDGVFETLRVYDGKPFLLDEHIKRLKKACSATKITLPLGIKEGIHKLIKANKIKNTYLRITVTRGTDKDGYKVKKLHKPTVLIHTNKLNEDSIAKIQKSGVSAIIKDTHSLALEGVKTTSLANLIAKDGHHNKVTICTDSKGYVTETLTGNIFIVKNKSIITPHLKAGILAGVTRGSVLKLTTHLGRKAVIKPFKSSELLTADEVFITNSIWEIVPVVKVNGRKVGRGEVTKELQLLYKDKI